MVLDTQREQQDFAVGASIVTSIASRELSKERSSSADPSAVTLEATGEKTKAKSLSPSTEPEFLESEVPVARGEEICFVSTPKIRSSKCIATN